MKIQYFTLLRNPAILLASVALLSACNKAKPPGPLAHAAWILGTWQNNTPRGVLSEVWRVKDDSTYAGKSSFVVGKDTVSSETIALGVRGGKLLYIPTVKDQNNGQPVTFTEKMVTASEMIFENPAHDFPQRITYTHSADDSLVAVISGMKAAQEKSLKFPMRRVK